MSNRPVTRVTDQARQSDEPTRRVINASLSGRLIRLLATVMLVSLSLLPTVAAAQPNEGPVVAPLTAQAALKAAAAGDTTWYFAEGFTGSGFDEYLTILNPGADGSATISYYVEGESTPRQFPIGLAANSRTTIPVHGSTIASLGRLAVGHATKVESSVPVVVERPMYFTYNGTITDGHNVIGATALDYTWLFAEGFTNTGFDEYLTIFNPGAAGTATVTYFLEGQVTPVARTVTLASNSRTTIAVHADYDATTSPYSLGRFSVGHSTRVESSVPVVVERPMYFQYSETVNGGHNVIGSPGRNVNCSATLSGANEVPPVVGAASGLVRLSFNPDTGRIRGEWLIAGLSSGLVAAHIHEAAAGVNGPVRINFATGNTLPTGGGIFSTTTTPPASSTTQVAAILANPAGFYVNAHTTNNPGGEIRGQLNCSTGSTSWLFAEGFTGEGFDEYLTILNPNNAAGTATIDYLVEGQATPTSSTLTLPASSRTTVAVHGNGPNGLGRLTVGHSTRVTTTVPTIIERPMYFTYGNDLTGGHDVMAAPGRLTWCLATLLPAAEVPPTAGTAAGLVQLRLNPLSGQIDAYWLINGLSSSLTAAHIHEAAVGVNGPVRISFATGNTLPTGGGVFSTTTVAPTSTPEQVAAILANPGGYYVNVHTTTNPGGEIRGQISCGSARGTSWLFAEGFTGEGFDEYLTIANPGLTAGTATITYFLEGQSNPIPGTINLPANSRTTIAVHNPADATYRTLGRLTSGHATQIESTVPVVVERPMYFAYGTDVTGGHDVMGATNRVGAICSATLSGANEVPSVAGTTTSSVQLAIDPDSGQIRGNWLVAGLSSNLTAAHIHEGAAGVNGPVRVSFVTGNTLPPTGGAFNTTSTATTAQVAAILANPNGYYVNVHTTNNGGGEMRGQLVCLP